MANWAITTNKTIHVDNTNTVFMDAVEIQRMLNPNVFESTTDK
jgi:hypothetical protein